MVRSMGKKRKGPGRKKLRAYVCVFMCALMLFQSAEPSSGAIAAPPGDALNGQDYLEPDINDEAEKDENDLIGTIAVLIDLSELTDPQTLCNESSLEMVAILALLSYVVFSIFVPFWFTER